LSRLSIRLRLTLAFALAMALVLAAVGVFLYLRLGSSLLEQVDDRLEARAEAVSASVQDRGRPTADDVSTTDDEEFAQVLDTAGEPLVSTDAFAGSPLLTAPELERARSQVMYVTRDSVAALDEEPARLRAQPIRPGAEGVVVVVGASLEDRAEALQSLLRQLLIVGPIALIAASTAGWLLAGAALRPVEAMRSMAARISGEQPGQRLPLPAANDEIRRLGETLNQMLGRLEAGLERERRFVADASHELRTPLATLQTELELALRRPRSSEELEQALRSAAEEVDRLTQLAEGLLVLARVDEGGLPLQRAPVSTRDVLDAVARRFGARAAAAGRSVDVAAAADMTIVADRLRLEQALGNLVDNALRHGRGTVRLEAERRDGQVELRVRDEGSGFPPDFLPVAFDRFTSADEARTGGGAGLGLALADSVARTHVGIAPAENGAGDGAVVSLELPLS
jgi:two-component system, OmpR family, sensor kinase